MDLGKGIMTTDEIRETQTYNQDFLHINPGLLCAVLWAWAWMPAVEAMATKVVFFYYYSRRSTPPLISGVRVLFPAFRGTLLPNKWPPLWSSANM